MQSRIYYTIMPDGTVKQLNPFTGTEVWAVGGRKGRPVANGAVAAAKPLAAHDPEDYCSFCQTRYQEVPPEKSRVVLREGRYERIDMLPVNRYGESVAEFRRVGNMFEIVTLDYWRKNYSYKIPPPRQRWKEEYLANPAGLKHVLALVEYKLRQEGKTEEQIAAMPQPDRLAFADAFFGGGHEQIIARRHYKPGAQKETDLYASGEMTEEEHFHYFKATIDAMRDMIQANRYVRYVSVFQNWLRPAGASFDHLHKQLVTLDEWGASIQHQISMLRDDPNVFNDLAANFASHHNLVFAENNHAIALAGIGHRFPTVEIYSRSQSGRPYEHSDDEIRGMSDMIHAVHAALGGQVSCNEEWYYTPVDAVYKMPWHVLIKLRVNVPAGFEGGTSIHINPITPIEMRDRVVPQLYVLRDQRKVGWVRLAEECKLEPNPLRYFLK